MSSSTHHTTLLSPRALDSMVKLRLEQEGYIVTPVPVGDPGTFEALKSGVTVSVHCRSPKRVVGMPIIQKVKSVADVSGRETWLISLSGYSKSALTYLAEESNEGHGERISLFTFCGDNIEPVFLHPDHTSPFSFISQPVTPTPSAGARKFIGVFTNKGGTGKTTVAAHLGGVLALNGYDVALLDLDPQKNLAKLFARDKEEQPSIFVKSVHKGQEGTVITVFDYEEWLEGERAEKVVICDCNPTLEENPEELIRELDYVLIPTTLNPMGVGRKSDVIDRTFNAIRKTNNKAEMFVLVNLMTYDKRYRQRLHLLFDALKKKLDSRLTPEQGMHLIDPFEQCSIRRSDSLCYWGMHIVTGEPPTLALNSQANSAVRNDFLALADFLENHESIRICK